MIISHKHKFIFIKTKKTAGTSIEILLSKYCGEDDIITPISPEDELIRKELQYRTAQNYLIEKNGYTHKLYNHMSAEEIIKIVGKKLWEEYYTFCFERNPWEKAISFYYFKSINTEKESFSQFIRSSLFKKLSFGEDRLYLVNNKIGVDKIYLYEDLNNALKDILTHLKIHDSIELPNAKTKFRKDKRSYRDILAKNDIDYINSKFNDEIEMFYPKEKSQ